MSIFAVTRKCLDIIVADKQKRPDVLTVRSPRKSGKHVPKHALSDAAISVVKCHITKYPSCESHYSHSHTNRKYLAPHLNVTKLYDNYVTNQNSAGKTYISYSSFGKIFKTMNLSFRPPYLDTCKTCDTLHMAIKTTNSEIDRMTIKQTLIDHQDKAKFAYDQKKIDKLKARENVHIHSVTFDLQQCLPTPDLTTSVVFYKRLLWTYNLTCHDQATNNSQCFLWNETIAGRGSNEIASCLYKYIQSLPIEVTTLNLYSDTCGGQNRNFFVSLMFCHFLFEVCDDNTGMTTINHKFLEPGHTHLECDVDHAKIERAKKKI